MNEHSIQHATALVAGSTGLVGTALRRNLTSPLFDPVWLLARSPLED